MAAEEQTVDVEEPTGEVVTPEEAEDFKPSGAELVIAHPDDQHEVALTLDRHDEEAVIAEFQSRALKVMLYDFPQGGSRIVDLSYQGVNEAVRLLNSTGKCEIGVVPGSLMIEETTEDVGNGPEPFVVATVYARDERTGYGQYGTAMEPKRMRLTKSRAAKMRKDGKKIAEDDTIFDVFARAKAISKSQRNALKVMIPEGMRQTLIAQYRGDDEAIRAIRVGAGAEAIAELPPPLDDERAQALVAECKDLYTQIRGHSAIRVLPKRFHYELSRAAHSHDLLEAFRDTLKGTLEDEQRKAAAA